MAGPSTEPPLDLHPVARPSASDGVYDQLAASILDGGLAAGEPMPSERVLAEALGVSRPVVREALKRLDQSGLVRIRHGGATVVNDFRRTGGPELLELMLFDRNGDLDLAVARSIIEARSQLGPVVAATAAEHATPDDVAALTALVDEMRRTDDVAALQRLAMSFWDRLVDTSRNLVHRLLFNALRRAYEPAMDALTAVMRAEVSHDGYGDVVAALEAGDPDAAAAATRAIVDQGARATVAVIDELLAATDDLPEEDGHG